jgi:hypothetical protein
MAEEGITLFRAWVSEDPVWFADPWGPFSLPKPGVPLHESQLPAPVGRETHSTRPPPFIRECTRRRFPLSHCLFYHVASL